MNFNSPPPNKDDAMTSFQEAGIKTEKERNGQEDVPMAPSGDEGELPHTVRRAD